ncbi:MAG: hypothetical protein VW378_04980 [bacterium]
MNTTTITTMTPATFGLLQNLATMAAAAFLNTEGGQNLVAEVGNQIAKFYKGCKTDDETAVIPITKLPGMVNDLLDELLNDRKEPNIEHSRKCNELFKRIDKEIAKVIGVNLPSNYESPKLPVDRKGGLKMLAMYEGAAHALWILKQDYRFDFNNPNLSRKAKKCIFDNVPRAILDNLLGRF